MGGAGRGQIATKKTQRPQRNTSFVSFRILKTIRDVFSAQAALESTDRRKIRDEDRERNNPNDVPNPFRDHLADQRLCRETGEDEGLWSSH
jgi:hypothetical protein